VEKEGEGESAGGIDFGDGGGYGYRLVQGTFFIIPGLGLFHFFLSCIFPLMFLFFQVLANFFNARSTSMYIYISSRIASFSA